MPLLYPLRVLIVALWFFGVGFLLCLLAPLPGFGKRTNQFVRRFICRPGLWLLGIRLVVKEPETFDKARPCIFIVNHQHLLDFFVIGSFLPDRTVVIGKKSLRWMPMFGWLFYWGGNLFIDRSNNTRAVETMNEAKRKILAHSLSVIISPEGTRSHGRGLLPFKKGAFYLALDTGLPIQPIALSSFQSLNLHRFRSGVVTVECLEPTPTSGLRSQNIPELTTTLHEKLKKAIERLDTELASRGTSHPKNY